ncbi:hypothetical protein [Chryseobacterium sp. JV274]|jgi:hypothetical protein|uniref:hypothetical protein n=1 Tax=Chryseobacterium sp. JV274 TaxID=1932669 RepID=UPI000986948C|nr:hypothetical protein [Chryseobacterium sp. JV274]
MKNILSVIFIFTILLTACSKKESLGFAAEQDVKRNYDTIAVDSFSSGAVSVDIARKIRMSSPQYLDSVKQAKKLQEEESKLKAELEKENKAKQEEEKKKKSVETPSGPDSKTQ